MGVSATIVESQVDWITASIMYDKLAPEDDKHAGWRFAGDLLRAEQSRGNDMRPARVYSFAGFQCGQAFAGINEQGYLIRLSGHLSAEHWQTVYHHSTGVSRLDLAVTVCLTDAWVDLSRIHHQEALDYQRDHDSRLRVTRIDGGKHGCTLTVGSRSSDGYARCYDKEAESGLDFYQDCWRYELELKKALAVEYASLIDGSSSPGQAITSAVVGWLGRRGVTPVASGPSLPRTHGGRPMTDDQRRLAWLETVVRPTIQRLIDSAGPAVTLDSLGLSGLLSDNSRGSKTAHTAEKGKQSWPA